MIRNRLAFLMLGAGLSVMSVELYAVENPPQEAISPLNCARVESLALAQHPILAEKALEMDKSREVLREIEMGAILPKFEVETGIGPAPGIRTSIDSSLVVNRTKDAIYRTTKTFDYSDWGPFFGVQMKVAQPLNIARFLSGKKAAQYKIAVSSAEFQKERMEISEEIQTLYYQRLQAITMHGILESARRELDKGQKKMVEQLDAGEDGVSQTDLLQLKSGRSALEQGFNESQLGMDRTALAMNFYLGFLVKSPPVLADSTLGLRAEAIPSLDSLKQITLRDHPDLKRLENGLAARKELLKVAQGEMGPDLFLFGSFTYSKAWSSDRQTGGNDPFARDPLNEITGVAGVGMTLRLNFWQRYQKYRKERWEFRQLKQTEVYAARGLLLKMEDAYVRLVKAKSDAEEAQKALRASEAWLKGAAMKYDLDPSTGKDLIAPFRQTIFAKRDYYATVLEYNLSVARLIKSLGWTLSDYLRNLSPR